MTQIFECSKSQQLITFTGFTNTAEIFISIISIQKGMQVSYLVQIA